MLHTLSEECASCRLALLFLSLSSERESGLEQVFESLTGIVVDKVFARGPKTHSTGMTIGFRLVRVEEHNKSVFSSSTIDQWTWCIVVSSLLRQLFASYFAGIDSAERKTWYLQWIFNNIQDLPGKIKSIFVGTSRCGEGRLLLHLPDRQACVRSIWWSSSWWDQCKLHWPAQLHAGVGMLSFRTRKHPLK